MSSSRLPHPAPLSGAPYSAVELMPGDREVVLLDQRALPAIERYDRLDRVEQVATAIETLAVRGAPAIGIAAAYGLVLAAAGETGGPAAFAAAMDAAGHRLRSTRPTAVNLAWAIERMARTALEIAALDPAARTARMAAAARAIHAEDVAACWAMGKIGAERVPDGAVVLTHCNAGALATGGVGTALGVVRAARAA
ncbi:MAG TPA: S-methyl-5-thioribose-1-phosphate isomerase, partial [Polyangiaceae bacterium]|nr:S-methyl-5-thioribose-1-phosphate isomerase [Polyangiaceae bacterium]